MISEIQIENFKSISKLSLKPGNVTVLIGENGSGKSNILEAITFAAAASADKLDDEFLFNRGIRVTEKDWMVSAFNGPSTMNVFKNIHRGKSISLKICGEDVESNLLNMTVNRLHIGEGGIDRWMIHHAVDESDVQSALNAEGFGEMLAIVKRAVTSEDEPNDEIRSRILRKITAELVADQMIVEKAAKMSVTRELQDFLIYAPENSFLRRFEDEGAIKPLGPKGEGLLKLLQTMSTDSNGEFAAELKKHLNLLGWFGDLQLPTAADEMQGRLRIRDRWLSEDAPFFDQRSANEGFLFLLFYFTLLLSSRTPRFFAIDNIDNALNPKLCAELMRQIAVLAAEKGKQVICTTHNPAILDGLNLHDDRQRLYVVRRDSAGHTVVNRVQAPRPRPDGGSVPLSRAFMSGMLGGLPDHF